MTTKSILERNAVEVADVEALHPAISAFVRGRIDTAQMAGVLTEWVRGQPYDLGVAESLPEKIVRTLAMAGPCSPKDLAKRTGAELDSVYHALSRLERRQVVRCDRATRPYAWALTSIDDREK